MDTNTLSNDCLDFNSDRIDYGSTGFSTPAGVIPEPSTLLLLGSCLAGLAGVGGRRGGRK